MNRSRTGMFLIGLMALALSAGVVAGMLVARLPASKSSSGDDGNVLAPPPVLSERSLDDLRLNDTQRDQMRAIWEGVRGNVHRAFEDARKLEKDQLVELGELMKTPEQQEAFKKITQKYADRYDSLVQERNRMFDAGVEATNKILTPEQQKIYAEIRQKLRQSTSQPATVGGTAEKRG